MANDVAVAYLARFAEGPAAVHSFVQSYHRHRAGYPHRLFLLAKGYSTAAQVEALGAAFAGIPHTILRYGDNIGRDIATYLRAAREISEESICFFNSFTELSADDWLLKLQTGFTQQGVGLAGSTGSYESLLTDSLVLDRVRYISEHAAFDADFARQWAWFHNRSKRTLRRPLKRGWRAMTDVVFRRPDVQAVIARLEENPTAVRHTCFPSPFPPFPNPHIRSNGFLVRRRDLLHFDPREDANDRFRGFIFESGYSGLSHRIRERGERLVIVDACGTCHDVEDWPASRTFRAADTSNLLTVDNKMDHFYRLPNACRETLWKLTFGGKVAGIDLDATPLAGGQGAKHLEMGSSR